MIERLADQEYIEKLCDVCRVGYFDDSMRLILEDVIKELFYSKHQNLICNLRPKHMERAIFKYTLAKEKTYIGNTKQYFKACVVSAIKEIGLDELEPLEFEDGD